MKKNKNGNSEKKTNIFLIIIAIVLSVMITFLLIFEAVSVRDKTLSIICSEKSAYLSLLNRMLVDGDLGVENIGDEIEKTYPTTASDFCYVALDGDMIFVRDGDLTVKNSGKNADTYLGISERGERVGDTYVTDALFNGRPFKVIRIFNETEEGNLTLGIALSVGSIVSAGNYDIQIEHIAIYMILLSLSFIVSVIFLAHREREMKRYQGMLKQKLEDNWVLIGKLGERIEGIGDESDDNRYGFTTKEVMGQVITDMTDAQRKNSRKIEIRLLESKQSNLVRYTVVLERMKMDRSICCLWDKDVFVVLMLNTSDNAVDNFVKQFLLQYQSIFRKDARDVHITVGEAVL